MAALETIIYVALALSLIKSIIVIIAALTVIKREGK